MQEDEREWCMKRWNEIRPYLEGMVHETEEQMEPVLRPSSAVTDVVNVVDSWEETQPEGSKKQMVMEDNGTMRELSAAKEEQILMNEMEEELAADDLKKEEQDLLKALRASEFREWEAWIVRSGAVPRGRSSGQEYMCWSKAKEGA